MLPIACIPGLLGTALSFGLLADKCARPIVPISLPPSDDFTGLADHVVAALPPRCIVLGVSFGSYLAYAVQQKAPEKVAGLVLLATTALSDAEETAKMRSKVVNWARKAGMAAMADSVGDTMLAPENRNRTDLRETIALMADTIGLDCFEAHQRALAQRPDFTGILADIDCPVLVLTGEHDTTNAPELGETVAAAVPDGRFVRIAGAGHLAILEAPDAIAAEVNRFCDTLDGERGNPW